jgi:hypothetical protein
LNVPLEEIEPPDDAGADTLGRFQFQIELTLQDCLAAIVEERIERVICEFHEDYIVYRAGAPRCLVSVKHLEESRPRWTLRGLCDAGGVFHLFGRWRAASEDATCLLRTNTGLLTGHDKPGGLQRCCTSGDEASRVVWAERLEPIFNEKLSDDVKTTVSEVERFLTVLRLEDQLPKRTEIRAHNIVYLMPEVLQYLGQPADRTTEIYDLLVQEVDRACRKETDRSMLAMLADPDRLDGSSALASTIEAKTITKGRLLRAIARPREVAATTLRVQELQSTSASRLKAKLAKGGFGPTAINNARNLRLHWEAHRHRWSSDLPVHIDRFEEAKAIVLGAAEVAENRTRSANRQPYGATMLEELRRELASRRIDVPGSNPGDVELLVGCAFQLTDECVVWWSDEFEIGDS